MKHLFIINPAAGKYDHTGELTDMIRATFQPAGANFEILVSRAPGDCTHIAQAAALTGEELRIYACGGDGTLNEVVNGVATHSNVAITHVPCGSGNDFIRIFSDPGAFHDLSRLLEPEETRFDLVRCQGKYYSINISCMGLDARIGTQISQYKRLPLVTGHGAYLMSTVVNVIRRMHQHFVIELDDEVIDGRQTMICIANGRWYGGGFYAAPDAQPDDGLLDVLMVAPVTRLTAARVIGKYKEGRYREFPDLIHHYRCRRIVIHCDQDSDVNLDGELLMAKDVTFEAVPRVLRFFYPRGIRYTASPAT